MYTSFFGLSDIPFSIAPNPDYLFLGDRHKEALAHLTYGLGDTGGFVLLTGEVGTGKTTISRRLLEQLNENTQVAFILNPTLSCIELLASICDELKIRYKKTGTTLKYLTDKIQEKLLKNQSDNIDTLLIIDEAQHLQPEVLEQLRLLTNLETNTKKLLQVILIGQPELQQLLQRRDLRQLAQRITARYHLLPLSKNEVSAYIKHRLSVADCHRILFKPNAIKLIHRISKGIPRLINLLCDRALANAYGNNESLISAKTVIVASEQALGSEYHLAPWWKSPWTLVPAALFSVLLLGGVGYWLGSFYGQSINGEQTIVERTENAQTLPLAANTESIEANEQSSAINNSDVQLSERTGTEQPASIDSSIQVNGQVQTQDGNVISPSEKASSVALTGQELRQAPINDPLDIAQKPKVSSSLAPEPINTASTADQPVTFDVSAIEGVSDELLAKVQSAIKEESEDTSQPEDNNEPQVPSLLDMPSHIQDAVPSLQFEVHIYASDGNGWVQVNGRERYEGDKLVGDVILHKILQSEVILSLDGQYFSLPALTNW